MKRCMRSVLEQPTDYNFCLCILVFVQRKPTVNALQSAGWEFTNSLIATGGVATLAFFTGLRLARLAYSPMFEGVEEATYANLKGMFYCMSRYKIC